VKSVLFVSTSTTVGGAEKTLYTIATLIDPSRYRVSGVVSLKPKGHFAGLLEKGGVRVDSLEVRSSAGFGHLRELAVLIERLRPDIVHAVMFQAMQLCRAVRRLGYADFRLLTSPRVNFRTRPDWTLWLDSLLRSADDLLVAESEATRSYLVEKRGYPPDKVVRIYNGVDLAGRAVSKAERARARERLGFSDGDVVLGSVGRLDAQKGHVFLLEAVAKLRALHAVKCVIAGDGPLKAELERKIRELGLQDSVRLAGELGDIPGWLPALDIFVQPSLWEGLPNALLEAMALGLPAVATRVDGIPEVVRHEVSGFLCEPKDSQALFLPIHDLVADEGLRLKLGESARKVILENFKLSDMISRYEEAYARVSP
jgi:glycosyltransferase involved in cell wall biosynthesis